MTWGGGTDWQREKNTDRTEKIDTESGRQSLSSKSESKQDKSLSQRDRVTEQDRDREEIRGRNREDARDSKIKYQSKRD